MEEALFVCCSGFQVFTALWMTHHHLKNTKVDFFIDSFVKGYEDIAVNLQKTGLARKVYYGQCDSSYYKPSKSKLSRIIKAAEQFFRPQKLLNDAANINGNYSKIYIGCCDEPRRLLCSYLAKRQIMNPEIILYDEGTGTYGKVWETAYYNWWHGKNIKCKLNAFLYRDLSLLRRFNDVCVFEPENMMWKPNGVIRAIDKISVDDKSFKELANLVFDYKKCPDRYEEKYIYLGNYFAPEIEILNRIATVVGKENIIVKRHPRERREQFVEAGYKSNTSDSVMWEIILLNMNDVYKKTFISIASSALFNMFSVLDMNVKAVSIIKPVEKEGLCGNFENTLTWQTMVDEVLKYKDRLKICETFDEIET